MCFICVGKTHAKEKKINVLEDDPKPLVLSHLEKKQVGESVEYYVGEGEKGRRGGKENEAFFVFVFVQELFLRGGEHCAADPSQKKKCNCFHLIFLPYFSVLFVFFLLSTTTCYVQDLYRNVCPKAIVVNR